MKKRDFIQQAATEFLPQVDWDLDKSIRYAEKLWHKLDSKGYGDSKQSGPQPVSKAYDKLNDPQKTQFDLFWRAFAYKQGRDRAAGAWLKLGTLTKDQHLQIIKAARIEAQNRKNLPEGRTPIMAEGWLSHRRFQDQAETAADHNQQQQQQAAAKIREITSALNHAKQMSQNTEDDYWPGEVERLTEQLIQLRRPS